MTKAISIIWITLIASLHAVEVTANLSSNNVPAGQGVVLTVTLKDASPQGNPEIPNVPDLVINPRGTSQQMQMTNGNVSRSIVYSFVVGSNQAGDYQIPAITVRANGNAYQTEPLNLTVGASPNATPQGMDEGSEAETPGTYGHLQFQMVEKDRKYVYPGEIAPVKIQAYFPADARVSLSSMPRPEGSAFTLHNLSKEPRQSSEVIDGKRYLVVTWFGGLSATKAGEYPASFKITGTVAVRDRSAQRQPGAGNPFFGPSPLDDFFAPMIQKDVELSTQEPPQIEVRELPQEGRPANFTGAIGEFEFQTIKLPQSLKTGEPFQIEAVVRGTGNFSLLSAPKPIPDEDWKTYKGSDNFVPEDVASFAGTKSFRYNAVPLTPGEKKTSLSFSYFDPEKGEYREVTSPMKNVVVTGDAVTPSQPAAEAGPKTPQPSVPELAPIATKLGSAGSYHPLSEKTWFTPTLVACGALSLIILGSGWWKNRSIDPAKEARKANQLAVQEALQTAEKAAATGDAPAFFSNARNALRRSIAEREGMNPEAVTLNDLNTEDETIAGILTEADRLEYSRNLPFDGDLTEWNAKLEASLARLETQTRKETA